MSNSLLNLVFQKSEATGTARVMMLAIADCLNDGGTYQPSIEQLALMCRINERNARYVIRQLEELGELKVTPGYGRGNRSTYEITLEKGQAPAGFSGEKKGQGSVQKGQASAPFNAEKGQYFAPFSEMEKGQSGDEKGQSSVVKGAKQRRTLRNTQLPNIPHGIHEGGNAPRPPAPVALFEKGSASKSKDIRLEHPAVVAYRDVTHRTPPDLARDPIISAVGNDPDAVEEWREHVRWCGMQGWNLGNVAAMLETFRKPRLQPVGRKEFGNGKSRQGAPARVRVDFTTVKSAV